MLKIDDELAELLKQTHRVEYRATAFYGGASNGPVPITSDGSLRWNADAVVQCEGSLFLAKDSESLVPKSKADVLAPYGQEIRLDRVDFKGPQEWVTPLGVLRIAKVPSMREYFKKYPSRSQLIGWSAQLDLQDRFAIPQADDFLYPDFPRSTSTYAEIQRLSPVPIVVNPLIPDAIIPASLTAYPDSRMDALTQLYANLGADPHMTRYGQMTGRRKDSWLTETVPVFTIRGVIDMDDSLSNDLYNAVKVSSSAGGNDLFSVEEIRDPGNPLRVNGPFGRRVFTQSSPLYDTKQKLDAAAQTILARVSSRQSRTVKVKALPQPHLELGDYIRAEEVGDDGVTVLRTVDGEITGIDAPLNPVASWTYELIVSEAR